MIEADSTFPSEYNCHTVLDFTHLLHFTQATSILEQRARAFGAVTSQRRMLASALPDVLFCAFLFTGLERVRITPGITAVNALDMYGDTDVLFALVLMHWFLDFVSHRPDMPLAPGDSHHFGLAMWNSVTARFVVEGLLWVVSIALYTHVTRAKRQADVFAFRGLISAFDGSVDGQS